MDFFKEEKKEEKRGRKCGREEGREEVCTVKYSFDGTWIHSCPYMYTCKFASDSQITCKCNHDSKSKEWVRGGGETMRKELSSKMKERGSYNGW